MHGSLQGHFLVASPHLSDSNFYRSVVLLVQHNENGAFGLVINRPSRQRVDQMWKQVTDESCSITSPVFIGGPISGPIMLLHGNAAESDIEVKSGIHFTSDKEKILRLMQQGDPTLRLFNGYSGWAPGQLERELKIGGWLTIAATPQSIFKTSHDEIWQKLTHEIGRKITCEALNLRARPTNPNLN